MQLITIVYINRAIKVNSTSFIFKTALTMNPYTADMLLNSPFAETLMMQFHRCITVGLFSDLSDEIASCEEPIHGAEKWLEN